MAYVPAEGGGAIALPLRSRGGGAGSGGGAPGFAAGPGRSASPGRAGSPGFDRSSSKTVRLKIGITISQRSASWSYRTTASPLGRASHTPPNPAKTVFVLVGPYSVRPVTSYLAPFFVNTASCEFTI